MHKLPLQSKSFFSGFTQESFNLLEQKAKEEGDKGKDVLVSLVFDEVSIRKKLDWTGKTFIGCVDFGKLLNRDNSMFQTLAVVSVLVARLSVQSNVLNWLTHKLDLLLFGI